LHTSTGVRATGAAGKAPTILVAGRLRGGRSAGRVEQDVEIDRPEELCLERGVTNPESVASFARRVSCQMSADEFSGFDPFDGSLPAACRALEQRCPGLLLEN
jgi:hypothetical protein